MLHVKNPDIFLHLKGQLFYKYVKKKKKIIFLFTFTQEELCKLYHEIKGFTLSKVFHIAKQDKIFM